MKCSYMYCSFQSSFPTWESNSLEKQFLSNLRTFRDQKLQEINTRHSSSPTSSWWEAHIHRPGLTDNNNIVIYRDIPRNRRNHVDSMWLIDSDQRNHPYLLDWYYTCQPHNRTNHQPILITNQNSADDCWPPNLGVRGEDMKASTSGQLFSERILRHHHQPEGEENYGNHHDPLDGRRHWWGRDDRSHNGATLPATLIASSNHLIS